MTGQLPQGGGYSREQWSTVRQARSRTLKELRQLDPASLDLIPGNAQVDGVLVQPMNQVEQALTQYFVLELFRGAHHIQRCALIVGGNGIEQFAHAS